jgi:hypothetical protein
MLLPEDYLDRVYAGVLGKMIGVYLGRPFEGWTYERIQSELGDIQGYVHELLGKPLIVTDDDLSGTFTFLRALQDYGVHRDLSATQIGETWLNYLIDRRTTLWWGGMGNSTEHTAYLRLKSGFLAPKSGSASLNGQVIAEQIGAQIFIDGWGMVAPGNPELAASLAQRAASVSHDGEAVYAAQVIAAMEALAFIEPVLDRLLDAAVDLIPNDCLVYRLIANLREWRAAGTDWRAAREKLAALYGYGIYPGNCHIIPNHGIVILSLLWGEDDFRRSLSIANTCGWDTDCNSGNVGCLLGIKNSLASIDANPDLRSPLADRMLIISADGGEAVTDAVRETGKVANIGRTLAGELPCYPKEGARFHFEAPGSVQGFCTEAGPGFGAVLRLENVFGHSSLGSRSLALHYDLPSGENSVRASTPTFILPEEREMPGYELLAAPTLYSGQEIVANLQSDVGNPQPVTCRLFAPHYGSGDELQASNSPSAVIKPGDSARLKWKLELPPGATVYRIGLEVLTDQPSQGAIYLDSLGWSEPVQTVLADSSWTGKMWRRAWVDGVDSLITRPGEAFRLVQNRDRGLLMTGTREWQDYRLNARFTPHLASACGIAVRVQGMRRYYGFLLYPEGLLRLVRVCAKETILAETSFPWEFWQPISLTMQASGQSLKAWVGDQLIFDLIDYQGNLDSGGVGLVIEEGCLACDQVQVDACSEAN